MQIWPELTYLPAGSALVGAYEARARTERTPHDATTRLLDVSVVEDDCRRLAAQLKRHRRPAVPVSALQTRCSEENEQVLRGSLGNNPTDSAASGIENMVVAKREERSRLRDRTVDDLVSRVVEVLGHERGDESGGGRALFGRLDDCRAAGADGSEKRSEKECCEVLGSKREELLSRKRTDGVCEAFESASEPLQERTTHSSKCR